MAAKTKKDDKKDEPVSREDREKALEKHFKERREADLPAHRAQEYQASANGVEVVTLAGKVYVKTDGEVELDQTATAETVRMLQAAFQAVS